MESTDIISGSELRLREALSEAFLNAAHGGQKIPAASFQAGVKAFGLSFGSPEVDRIMLLCKIDDDGNVDFSKFVSDTQSRRVLSSISHGSPSARSAPSSPATSAAGPSRAGSSYEFRTALEATTGTTHPSHLPAELLSLPQSERVKRLAREIHTLYTSFDNALISMDTFRARLQDMGIVETPEITRVLHQSPMQFAKLYKALQNDSGADRDRAPSAVALFRPVPPIASLMSSPITGSPGGGDRPSSRFAARPSDRTYNPITGAGRTDDRVGEGIDRRAVVSPYNTAVASNILAGGVGGGFKGAELPRHLTETGAGNIIYNKGENASGVEYGPSVNKDYKFAEGRSKMGRGAADEMSMFVS